MIGAYGNPWIQTPTFDALACQSAVFDRFYNSSIDLANTFTELWQFLPDCHKILLTDDTDVFLHEHAGLFEEKHRLEPKRRKRPAGRLEETQFYRNMAMIADVLRHRTLLRNRTESDQTDPPFFLWAHFEGFRGDWDFPMSYRKRYQIDEDPDPYPGVALPEIMGNNLDPDTKQSVLEAYSGGVAVLDETLAGLLAFLEEVGLAENTMVLFMSTRGFSLGEHGIIGASDDLYGENVHLPLFLRFPDGTYSGFRSQTLLQPSDLVCRCSAIGNGGWQTADSRQQTADGSRWCWYSGVLPEAPDEVHPLIRIGGEVIVTPDWFVYQKTTGTELYVKPDDYWEVNDVADRCPHVLEQIGEVSCA